MSTKSGSSPAASTCTVRNAQAGRESHSQEMAAGLANAPGIPVRVVFKAVADHARAITAVCLEANSRAEVHRPDHLDAHVLARPRCGSPGLTALQEAVLPPAHAVQPRHPLVRDRHGFHEPEPGRPRRPRVRLHRQPHAAEPQGGRRHWQDEDVHAELGGLDARGRAPGTMRRARKFARFGDNMREVAVTEGDKVEAQISLGYSVNGYGIGDLVKCVERGHRRRRSTRCWRRYEAQYAVAAAAAARAATSAQILREAARIELGLRAFLEDGGLQGLHHHLRRSARPGAAARPGRAAPDGRRLRLRRRRRLEDRRPGARHEGDGAGLPAARPSWKTTPITSSRGGMKVLGRAHAGSLPVHRRRQAVAGNPPARHRRQGRSGAAGVQRRSRAGGQRLARSIWATASA